MPGPKSVKTQAALRVAEPLLSAPTTNPVNWTLARLADEIAAREGVTISKSQLSKALRKKGALAFAALAGIPSTAARRDPIDHDVQMYKWRHLIENCFHRN